MMEESMGEWTAMQEVDELLGMNASPEQDVPLPDTTPTFDYNTANTYLQQRAVHLFVMQQLLSQYTETMNELQKYLSNETQSFNRDIVTANEAEYNKLNQQIEQLKAFQSFYEQDTINTNNFDAPMQNISPDITCSVLEHELQQDSFAPSLIPHENNQHTSDPLPSADMSTILFQPSTIPSFSLALSGEILPQDSPITPIVPIHNSIGEPPPTQMCLTPDIQVPQSPSPNTSVPHSPPTNQATQNEQPQPNAHTNQPRSPTKKSMKFHVVNYHKRPFHMLTPDGPTIERSQRLLPSLPSSKSISALSSDEQIHAHMQNLNQQMLSTQYQPPTQHTYVTLPQPYVPIAASSGSKLQIVPELLTMKQSDAAKVLGISASMLSKRWREAMHGQKWPYRLHRKMLDTRENEDMYNNQNKYNKCESIEQTIFAGLNAYVEI